MAKRGARLARDARHDRSDEMKFPQETLDFLDIQGDDDVPATSAQGDSDPGPQQQRNTNLPPLHLGHQSEAGPGELGAPTGS